MKKLASLIYVSFLILFTGTLVAQETILFQEDFENDTIPEEWTEKYVSGSIKWQFRDGGYSTENPDDNVLLRRPPGAYSGNYNAMFQFQTTLGYSTKLITRQITSVEFAVKPELRFWHAQDEWYHGFPANDELRVYYKNGIDSVWNMLEEYTEPVTSWTERTLILPDNTLSGDYYLAFEGKALWGYGTCIDDIQIVETGVAQRYIDTIILEQPITLPVSTGLGNYQVFKLMIMVRGNEGDLVLNSIDLTSLNTDDNDIQANGVKLYYTNESKFITKTPITSGTSFTGGKAQITGINHTLETGVNYIWITYDIDENGGHGNIIDGKIEANNINVSGTTYPSYELSPVGSRTIYESVFYDDYETDKGWTLVPEFEIDEPDSLGGRVNIHDPEIALSGTKALGVDLTGTGSFPGDYELGLDRNEYTAMSPRMDLTYFKDINIRFKRWLNVYFNDTVAIEVSNDDGATWNRIWENASSIAQKEWSTEEYDISAYANRTDSIRVRFTLGGTDTTTNVTSGWNIEDFSVTGDYIANDVGVLTMTQPLSGCGHSSSDDVTVVIKNYGPTDSEDTIPVAFSLNGGSTFYIDTLFGVISSGGTMVFPFPTKADLSNPGNYSLVFKTILESDEFTGNDQFDTTIYIVPEIMAPFTDDFELNNGYWRTGGNRNVWEWGEPQNSFINDGASGQKAWVTDLNSYYQAYDSVYIESPCFNLSGLDDPIIQCNIMYQTKRFKDGAAFYYSIDDGASWQYLDTLDYMWDWDWYEDSVLSLGKPAFDSTSDGWMTVKQFLPLETHGQTNVKFRLLLKADTNNYFLEGIALDDFQILDAPVDVGVYELVAPDSACELSHSEYVKVAIKNYAKNSLPSGTVIPLGIELNDELYAIDTLTLSSDLASYDTVHYTFNDPMDMFKAGRYYLDIYTMLDGDTDYYVDTVNNDTLSTFVSVYGMPEYDLGPTIGMEAIDTILDAGSGYDTYDWEEGDSITQTYHVTAEGMYNVTVTNEHGCVKSDSVRVVLSVEDLGVSALVSPQSACEMPNDTVLRVTIQNFKGKIYPKGDTILVGYILDGQPVVVDSIFLADTLEALSTMEYEFNDPVDLSNVSDYQFTFFTILEGDLDYNNDTLNTVISTWGYPDVEIGPDTIRTSQADTIVFNAGAGFATYLWQNGSSASTFAPTHRRSKEYKVTVTDVNGCGQDTDSVQIIAYDFEISQVNYPNSNCELDNDESITVRIHNIGQDTILAGNSIPVSYVLDGQPAINENATLASNLLPGSTYDYTFTTLEDLSVVGDYTFDIICSYPLDIDDSNDSLNTTISNWGYPVIDLGNDTIFTSQPDTVKLVASPGYFSYNWNTGETNDTLVVTDGSSTWYSVVVANDHGCETKDSTYIYTYDLSVASIILPTDACEKTDAEGVEIRIINYSISTIPSGTSIPVSYQMNGGAIVQEDFVLTSDLVFYGSTQYTFANTLDMSTVGTYHIEASTHFYRDVIPDNDMLSDDIFVHGYPSIDLGPDTLFTAEADTIVLVAGPGNANYLWNTGSINDSLVVSDLQSSWYKVNVESVYGCESNDSIYIYTHDIGVSEILGPISDCELESDENISVRITNYSADTLPAGSEIDIAYTVNGGSSVMETLTLTGDLLPSNTVDYEFTTNIDLSVYGEYHVNAYTLWYNDVVSSNDNSLNTISAYGFPQVNLGNDTIVRALQHTLDAGGPYVTYEWQDGSSNQTLEIGTSGEYSVEVVDVYGCEGYDKIDILMLLPDFSISKLINPESKCYNNGDLNPVIRMINTGTDTIKAGESVQLEYFINNESIDQQSFNVSSNIVPGDSADYTFSSSLDVFDYQSHNFKLVSVFSRDLNPDNDTVLVTRNIYPFPTANLGKDTIIQSKQIMLATHYNGNYNYLWQDGITTDTSYTALYDGNLINTYSVTVSEKRVANCSVTDNVNVTFLVTDLELVSAVLPTNSFCENESVNVEVTVRNEGNSNISSTKRIYIGYVNSKGLYDEFSTMAGTLINVGSSKTLSGELAFKHGNTENVNMYLRMTDDDDKTNDTLVKSVTTMPAPVSDLGGASDTSRLGFPITLTPVQGQISYIWNTGSTESSITAPGQAWYWVDITGSNGCVARDSVYVAGPVDIPELIVLDDKLFVYPIPASEILHIMSGEILMDDYNFIIANNKGIIVKTGNLNANQKADIVVNVGEFPSGIYFLKVYNNNNSQTRKLIFNSIK